MDLDEETLALLQGGTDFIDKVDVRRRTTQEKKRTLTRRERYATDPEYRRRRQAEATKWRKANYARHLEQKRLKYLNDAEFRAKTIAASKARYYRMKKSKATK